MISLYQLSTAQNVGIGLSNPAYKLDIKGRIRIKPDSIGQLGGTPGMWLDNYLTGTEQAFIGMENDTYAGFYGKAGAGWGINFNTQTGNVNMGNSGFNIYRLNLSSNDFGLALYDAGNNFYGGFRSDAQGNLSILSANGTTTPSKPVKHIILNPPSDGVGFTPGNVGIGTNAPDYKLTIQSGRVEANTNTSVLKLQGQNPVMVLSDALHDYAYIKAWTYQPYTGFSNGLVLGAAPGNAIFLSTNYAPTVVIDTNNNVGIGTSSPAYKLSVNGTIQAKELRVETGWADNVFDEHYSLESLNDVEAYIHHNKHLKDIPSADDITQNGLAVAQVQTQMMRKIEELTLYVIALQKEINQLKKKRK